MLAKLEIQLQKREETKLDYNISSLFQGVLMEFVTDEYGEILHQTGLKPYAQYIEIKRECLVWNILIMTKEAKEQIVDRILSDDVSAIHIKHKDLSLPILCKKVKTITYDQLLDNEYFSNGSRLAEIQFISPTAFKSKGEYVFYPDLRLIFQSAMNKFDICCPSAAVGSEEVLEQLIENSKVVRYHLRSVHFHMEGVRIPAFLGTIHIRINGPQPLVNLVHLLLAFGEYSGIGIKCAMGMGGIKRIKKEERVQS